MKALLSKIPAVFGMFIALFSFIWYVQSFIESVSSVYTDIGLGSAILAIVSVPFFFIDAIISFVKARKKIDAKFNYILTLVLVGAIPMVVLFAGSGRFFHTVIWNVYYLLMFALEVVSIQKAWVAMRAGRKKAAESAEG